MRTSSNFPVLNFIPFPLRVIFVGLFLISTAWADVRVASPFGDHMVLQREAKLPVWGTATPEETVTVEFAGQKKHMTADANGRWRIDLDPIAASAEPRAFTVQGSSMAHALRFEDVLVGEVWICGGQSNMERQLGLRSGQKPIVHWEEEVAKARHPLIRQLYVAQRPTLAPQSHVEASWSVCSPETVSAFTAVGYFFARDLQAKIGVPIGIINSSYGGTTAEAWTSAEGLTAFPEFSEPLAEVAKGARDATNPDETYAVRLAQWFHEVDPGTRDQPWSAVQVELRDWESMTLPTTWDAAGRGTFDGIAWFRKSFDLPAGSTGDVDLHLSAIDDLDTTWVNGALVGSTDGWDSPRNYRVPAALLKPTGNVIAIRVLDTGGPGGIWDLDLPFEIVSSNKSFAPVPLKGPWFCRFAPPLAAGNRPPTDLARNTSTPSVFYNGMIAPLVPYAIRGVAFYQGESNSDRPEQYRRLFPALIADWRTQWGQGDFPFLFVQIAPFREANPELREAQLFAWKSTKNTAMVVTLDCGDLDDIHPAWKQPVGARLALAARAIAYKEPVEYSGPVYESLTVEDEKAVLHFSHLGSGLAANDFTLMGFTMAGPDGVFHAAHGELRGDTLTVTIPDVEHPVAVRYAWEKAPDGNLVNDEGLPASPFRTDHE